ncbi:uncharacterized protein LOC6044854 isoform X1 [Culex quinquefasciatus]|uniref:uncharacterized protein LOC6044854 isoform X1 n=1 Tax=Culex quinquefasciatus TaxID=7176 RepID=UPI0018E2AB2B|nr:uncharacterized protein LOC6044854 isoform X1 [Culex quinquefasciatus]
MALLLFRFCLVFAIGLFFLNGFAIPPVSAFVNSPGPDRLRLTVSPPAQVVITATKNSPVYLPCHAEADVDSRNDWSNSEMDAELDDGDYEDVVAAGGGGLYEDAALDLTSLAHDPVNPRHRDNDLDDEEEEEDDDEEYDEESERRRQRRRRQRYRRALYSDDDLIEYVWFRNGLEFFSTAFQNQNHKQSHKGFRLFPNGTLKIPYNRQFSNISAGVYRCKANLTRHAAGTIMSTESVVTIAYLERHSTIISDNNTVVAAAQQPLVLHCPFVSHPPANVTWMVNKTQILFNNYAQSAQDTRRVKDHTCFHYRYYQLQNGSLLMADVRLSDAGRYRCNATNNFAAKAFRSYSYVVNVQPASTSVKSVDRLLPRMQQQIQHVRTGSTLKLNCASEAGRPRWTFTPRQGKIPISLVNFTYQLVFVNVSMDKHDGVYNCSVGSDFQLFNVTVLVPPVFLSKITSVTSSVVASMSFNSTVSGNPKPKITWFKNGRELKNSYIAHYDYPMLRINTIDPEDEGLYQCIAKNEAGEASISMYLSIRDKDKYRRLYKRPENIQCYPVDTTSLYVRFDRGMQHINTEYAMYYLASDDPYSWYSSPPTQLITNNSLKITGPAVTPFRNYTVYLRACSVNNVADAGGSGPSGKEQVIPSKLSKGFQCTSQGVPVLSIFFPNGIFIWWPRFPNVEPTALTIQFKQVDDTDQAPALADHINGTLQILDDYITHEEVAPLLIPVNVTFTQFFENIPEDSASSGIKRRRRAFDIGKNPKQIFESLTGTQMDLEKAGGSAGGESGKPGRRIRQVSISQIKVPGNVTGVLIPNTNKLVVRILGSVSPDGEPMVQDYRYIQWKTIDAAHRPPDTVNRFQTEHLDARSVQFTWSRFIATDAINRCLMLCYKNVNHDVVIRGGSNRVNCLNIPKDATHYNLAGLLPFTLYKAFLRPCHSKEAISAVLDFQTKQDVPGPVTNHMLERKDGITLSWGPPENRNGVLQGYQVTWIDKDNVHYTANLTVDARRFHFPNVSAEEKINISIRAIGSTGMGIPIYVNLLNYVVVTPEPPVADPVPWVEIAIGTVMVVFFLLFCCLLVIHRRNCKKTHRNQDAANTTTMALQAHHTTNCSADIHEMQTLIRTPDQLPVLIPNGKYKQPQHLQIINALESVRGPANTTSNVASSSANGKSHRLSSNPRNGLLPHSNISSLKVNSPLPVPQPTVSSGVFGTSTPLSTLLNTSRCNHVVPGAEQPQMSIATSSNSIYRSSNSSYLNAAEEHSEPRAPAEAGLSTGDPISQLQPKHSSRATTTTTTTSMFTPNNHPAEQQHPVPPSSAATSTSLSSASNLSANSAGSSGGSPTISSCSVPQQQPLPVQYNHPYVATVHRSNHPANGGLGAASVSFPGTCFSVTPAEVRITENPQYSKTSKQADGYHHAAPSAVLNTSLFDSSQRRLLDLTIDSNSVEQYDDEDDGGDDNATNCDQNDDDSASRELPVTGQLTVRVVRQSSPSEEGDDNNNGAGRGPSLHNNDCRHQLAALRSHHDPVAVAADIVEYDHEEDDDNLEELDNSSALLTESGLSSKPLHQQHASSWNFRRPIVGPNG